MSIHAALTFHIFDFSEECWTDFDQTWQETSTQCLVSSVCGYFFFQGGGSSTKMTSLTSNWLMIHVWILFCDHLTELDKTLQEASTQSPPMSHQVCDFRADPSTNMATLASDWLRHFKFDFFSVTTERKLKKLYMKQILHAPTKKCMGFFFMPIRQLRWLPWSLIDWDIFYFSSVTTEFDETEMKSEISCDFFHFSSATTKRNTTKSKSSMSYTKFVLVWYIHE